ncbi:MAG: hypothetical protein HQ508_00360 [Candidatus Marinimicrobia bacterium]|nr:hypothetical protein [Candidatus Neomarinimicrobiota bacterium]
MLISSKQNFNISANLDFKQQGLKKRHRKKSLQIMPGDFFFFYLTGEQKLVCMTRVESYVSEANDKIWVNLGKDPNECYPWRFKTSSLILLPEHNWIPMEQFSTLLLHFKKWPKKNWRLGLQGQVHALRDEDTTLLSKALGNINKP